MLYLVRHAKAEDRETWGEADADRPLARKGQKQARKLAKFFSKRLDRVDVIASSCALRAKETAEPIAKAFHKELLLDERLNPTSSWDSFEVLVKECDDKIAIVVGHEPLISELVAKLCTENFKLNIKIEKAGVVGLEKKKRKWVLRELYSKV